MSRGLQVTRIEPGIRTGASPVETLDLEQWDSTRIFLVPWLERFDAYRQLLGYSVVSSSGALLRYLPEQHPEAPWLVANRIVGVKGIGVTAGQTLSETDLGFANKYTFAEITVQFGCRPYEIWEDEDIESEFERFVEVETTIEGDYLSLPNAQGVAKWAEGSNAGTAFPGQIGKIVCFENYVFRWHQVPDRALPESAILNTVGKVNQSAFGLDPLDNSRLYFGPGTLLMLGAGWRRIFSPNEGQPQWTVEYMMKFNKNGHNRFYDFKASVPDWYQVTMVGVPFDEGSIPDGVCVYDEAEYEPLFEPPAP